MISMLLSSVLVNGQKSESQIGVHVSPTLSNYHSLTYSNAGGSPVISINYGLRYVHLFEKMKLSTGIDNNLFGSKYEFIITTEENPGGEGSVFMIDWHQLINIPVGFDIVLYRNNKFIWSSGLSGNCGFVIDRIRTYKGEVVESFNATGRYYGLGVSSSFGFKLSDKLLFEIIPKFNYYTNNSGFGYSGYHATALGFGINYSIKKKTSDVD